MKKLFLLILFCCIGWAAAYVQEAWYRMDAHSENASGTEVFSWLQTPILSQTKRVLSTYFSGQASAASLGVVLEEKPIQKEIQKNPSEANLVYPVKKIQTKELKLPSWIKGVLNREDIDDEKIREAARNYAKQRGLVGSSGVTKTDENSKTTKLDAFAYRVHAFYPGKMANNLPIRDSGVITEDIIKKIVGAPDFSVWTPDEQDDKILSLGLGGIIVLEVQDGFVVNEKGPDFAVFENPFAIAGKEGEVFVETGIVSVAMEDREDAYRTFPCDSKKAPYQGCAGVNPVLYSADLPLDEVGGDLFDLETVGLEKIKYIKIQDTGDHPSLFPGKDGFDLDGIGLIHAQANGSR